MKTISINNLKEAVSEMVYPFVMGLVIIAAFSITAFVSMIFEMEASFQAFALISAISVITTTIYLSTDYE